MIYFVEQSRTIFTHPYVYAPSWGIFYQVHFKGRIDQDGALTGHIGKIFHSDTKNGESYSQDLGVTCFISRVFLLD